MNIGVPNFFSCICWTLLSRRRKLFCFSPPSKKCQIFEAFKRSMIRETLEEKSRCDAMRCDAFLIIFHLHLIEQKHALLASFFWLVAALISWALSANYVSRTAYLRTLASVLQGTFTLSFSSHRFALPNVEELRLLDAVQSLVKMLLFL